MTSVPQACDNIIACDLSIIPRASHAIQEIQFEKHKYEGNTDGFDFSHACKNEEALKPHFTGSAHLCATTVCANPYLF